MHKLSLILVFVLILKTSYSFGKLYSDKDGKRIEFSSYLGEDLWGKKVKPITSHGILYLPKKASNSSKFPLAILVPGLGGQRGRDNRMCDKLSQNGIACIGVRTYASRDIPHNQKWSIKFAIAGAGSRMHDAYGALSHLSDFNEIDINQSWFIGFSLGGFLAALSLDENFTKNFKKSNIDFKGFINLYGACQLTNNENYKQTIYKHFIGTDDSNYEEKECKSFIQTIKKRGVNASIKVFKGSQFKSIGHMWDSMRSAEGMDWYGKPEGPWRLAWHKHRWPQNMVSTYNCGLNFDFKDKKIFTTNSSILNPTDNDAFKFLSENCPRRKGTTTANRKVIKQVDEEIIKTIKINN